MTPKDYELAERRAWVENHFHQHGLTDEEIMAFLPLPSDNFTEGFRAGEEYARLNQWVSVDERLPEPDVEVLVCTAKGQVKTSCWYGEEPYIEDPRHNGWKWWGNIRPTVLYWMPLPKPKLNPKEKEDEE